MLLYVVRHCKTDYNDQQRSQGKTDLPLNDSGMRQAEALRRRFSNIMLDAIHTSPLKRAMQTAHLIGDEHKLEPKPIEGLMELDQGELEGMDMSDMARNFPDLLKKWIENPADTVLPGGESMRALQNRAWAAIESIVKSHQSDSQVVAVSHNLAICTLICKLLNIDLRDFRRFRLHPAGVTTVEFKYNHGVLICLNDTSHLDGVRD